jgi:exopolysaccharide production protein ExoZ
LKQRCFIFACRNRIECWEIIGMKRQHNLDYLRGLAAFGIMAYHFSSWTFGHVGIESFLGRVGLYGVSVFYVLSGLTLFIVYSDRLVLDVKGILSFAKKRIFRIFPLLWLAAILTLLLTDKSASVLKILLNLTGLFGFVDWNGYIALGSWSIGNELTFYAVFPLMIWSMRRSNLALTLLALVLFGFYVYFAFFFIDPAQPIASQWNNYVNPLNQVWLFMGGFLLGKIFGKLQWSNVVPLSLIVIGLIVFSFFPASGDPVNAIIGVPRMMFTLSCFLVCLGFYKLNWKPANFIHKPFSMLGEASYSLYLIHPILYNVILELSQKFYILNVYVRVCLTGIATMILSYFVYHYFEKFFMKLGRDKSGPSSVSN